MTAAGTDWFKVPIVPRPVNKFIDFRQGEYELPLVSEKARVGLRQAYKKKPMALQKWLVTQVQAERREDPFCQIVIMGLKKDMFQSLRDYRFGCTLTVARA